MIIVIKNHGDSIIQGVKVSYFNNEIFQNEFIFNDLTLNSGEEIELNFPEIENYNYGDIELSFLLEPLEVIEEIDYHNNRRMVRFKHKPIFELPYYESFETGINLDNWHIINSDFSRTWEIVETAGIENSDSSIYVNIFGYNPRDGQKDEFFQHPVPGSNPGFYFNYSSILRFPK